MLQRTTTDSSLSASSETRIFGRRMLFAALVLLTIAGLLALAAKALSAGGFGVVDALLLVLFGCTLPWSVIGFWNATIGFLVMRFAADPVARRQSGGARRARRRADHRLDRDHHFRAQRAAGARDPQSRCHDAGDRGRQAWAIAFISMC